MPGQAAYEGAWDEEGLSGDLRGVAGLDWRARTVQTCHGMGFQGCRGCGTPLVSPAGDRGTIGDD